MQRTIVAPAQLPGAALDELKQWLAIRSAAEDPALTALLRTALETCEAFTGRVPLACTIEEVLPASPDWQALSVRPVIGIAGVEGISADGVRFALAAGTHEVDIAADGTGRVRVRDPAAARRVAVRAAVGTAPSWDTLPDGLRQGIVRLAAHGWQDRDGGGASVPPAAVAALWRPWRRMRL